MGETLPWPQVVDRSGELPELEKSAGGHNPALIWSQTHSNVGVFTCTYLVDGQTSSRTLSLNGGRVWLRYSFVWLGLGFERDSWSTESSDWVMSRNQSGKKKKKQGVIWTNVQQMMIKRKVFPESSTTKRRAARTAALESTWVQKPKRRSWKQTVGNSNKRNFQAARLHPTRARTRSEPTRHSCLFFSGRLGQLQLLLVGHGLRNKPKASRSNWLFGAVVCVFGGETEGGSPTRSRGSNPKPPIHTTFKGNT